MALWQERTVVHGAAMKRTYVYRATQVEKWRRFCNDEWTTHDDLVASILGTTETNEAMEFGTTIHKLIEQTHSNQQPDNIADRYDLQSLQHCCDLIGKDALMELPAARGVYEDDAIFVALRGTADAVIGTTIVDFKTTLGSITERKIQSYQDSMQWRCYLWLFSCYTFQFVIHQWIESNGVYAIANQEVVQCDAYEGMADEVQRNVMQLHNYCMHHGIWDLKDQHTTTVESDNAL
jgi:hypothetical protein